jgi:hypothetical protein
MTEKSDRKELQRRLEQAKRAVDLVNDPVTTERLQKLVKDLEEQLRLSE